ncbi:MAG: glycerate kinase [Saccharofermentans sp.]|nr:glycerate kinase [Saccharofermentans sp.]
MVKIVVAIDSFKGSLTSMEAGNAAKEGILKAVSKADVIVRPLADGGEGTFEALTSGMGGAIQQIEVTGPLGDKVTASYGIIPESSTAVMEMSQAAGITLINESDRNPLNTTTYGVGEMIKDAIYKGCRKFIVGIGGSATNDGGIGMLQALGFKILDRNGKQVSLGARGLAEVDSISTDEVLAELSECEFKIACDVTNPLFGPNGASAVFGPQKGATPEMVADMDRWLYDFASICNDSDPTAPGTGAAGGLGFAFKTFTNSILESGIRIVLDETNLEDYIKDADLVITGEGRLDSQTVYGKAPIGVAAIAKQYNIPVIAFAGSVSDDACIVNNYGIDAFFPITRSICSLQEAMQKETAKRNLTYTVEQVMRIYYRNI